MPLLQGDARDRRTQAAAVNSVRPSDWILFPIVTASGFAGLGYEIVWTRMLSLTLGTEMMAVLGVVAGFFGGLALGAFALDGPIRRARSPRAAYAWLEGCIGIWGAISVLLLPAASRALPPLLGTNPPQALLWLAAFAVPSLLLLPATVAMGGTLAALERMVAASTSNPRLSAAIYGGNTAGAVVGTLASAFVLLPSLGLSGTLLCLAALNGACALAALSFGPAAAPPVLEASPAVSPGAASLARLGVALFATGLLGVAFEVLIVRLAAQVLQDTLFTFAGLLAAYLLGTAAGGLAWQRAPARFAAWLPPVTALTCLATAASVPPIARLAGNLAGAGIAGELAVAMCLFCLPAAGMGALFSHFAQSVRDRRGTLGWAVGVNSLGAAVAPIVTSLLLIPAFGAWGALLPVSLAYLLLAPGLPGRAAMLRAAPALVLGAVLIFAKPPLLIHVPEGGALIAVREGPMLTASVVDDASGARYLEVNGHFRMGGTSSLRSDYRQALVPLLLHPGPHSAVFLGLGTGATLVGGAQMPGLRVQGVELSAEVASLLPQFADPDVAGPTPPVTVADARRFVLADRSRYDVIIADLYHPALDGSGALYTTEHFAAVRARLAAGGLFCQWLPLYQLDMPSLRTILRTFMDIYPDGTAWLNHYSVGTPMLVLVGGRGPLLLNPATLGARLAEPDLARLTGRLGLANPIDLLGQFVAGPKALVSFAGEGPRNTDDFPAVSLDASRNVRALSAPRAALLLKLIAAVRPDAAELLAPGTDASWAPRLAAYWQARDRFLQAGAALQGSPRGRALIDAASPGLLDAIRLSPEFDPAYQPLLSMAQALVASDREAGMALVRKIEAAAPGRGEAKALEK